MSQNPPPFPCCGGLVFHSTSCRAWLTEPRPLALSPAETRAVVLDAERERGIRIMLMALGEDPDREGLRDTPRRVIKAWSELTAGNKMALNLTTFTNEGFTGMVAVGPVEFYSTCEHHLLPFFGSAWVAYIPGDKLLGLSKLPRVVEMFSRRLQNQERLTKQVGDCLKDVLGIEDVGVLFKGRHMCMMARGVKQSDALMTTPYLSGKFLSDPAVRAEFYALSHKD